MQSKAIGVHCIVKRGDAKRKEGNFKVRSEHIIFSGVELSKKFHRVSTSRAAVNIFLAMSIR